MLKELIDGRYEVVRAIARGSQGATYLARVDGGQVALKELDFAGIANWDTVSVFERESAMLGGLSHPNIPRIVESFRVEEEGSLRLFLAQEFVDGSDLRQRLLSGAIFDEPALVRLADELLDILVYLHGCNPPVLHRDIKPANVVQRPDGTIALVDFGAAQTVPRGDVVIGTTGYMAAEQLMGRAEPRSDLYSLGATLVHLATRKHPSDLGEGLGLRWRQYANLTERFTDWVDTLVQPTAEDRFASAIAAKRALDDLGQEGAELHTQEQEYAVMRLDDRANLRTTSQSDSFFVQQSGTRIEVVVERRAARWKWFAILLAAVVALAVLPELVLVIFVGAFVSMARSRKQLSRLDGTQRGLDIVWEHNEVVERLELDDITAPELTSRAVVIWRRDGSSVVLNGRTRADLNELFEALQCWYIAVRERA